jgi:hypothetical protein
VSAADIYQAPEAFVAEVFAGAPPAPRLLWLTGPRADAVREILCHAPSSLRVRYWAAGTRSAWVLEEIGKHHPITAGFVIDAGRVASARVLVYRESRGWEVRRPAFLAQLVGRTLTPARELDGPVDGISGATLSVAAMQRMTRLALFLAEQAAAPAPDTKE